jgi:hypothetical protein
MRVPLYIEPFEKVEKANQIWRADFKGRFRTGKGERIDRNARERDLKPEDVETEIAAARSDHIR